MGMADVSVIIPAFNAEATLETAVISALAQPETREVLIIDDASTDATRACAEMLAARDPRARLIALGTNGGPARARNHGIDSAIGARVAILDSDDFFLPGRLSRISALPDHDMAADDVAFVSDAAADQLDPGLFARSGAVMMLDTAGFATGNLSGKRQRGEMGFLKPVMSRAFLDRHGLRYAETLRLGEDVDLYLRALIAGARFLLLDHVGYCAIVRSNSLSARHGASDLASLCAALERQGEQLPVSPARDAVLRLAAQVRRRRDHRLFLDRKASRGLMDALRFAFGARRRAAPIAADILRDKLHLRQSEVIPPGTGFRTLLGDQTSDKVFTASSFGKDARSGTTSPGSSSTEIRRASGR